MANRWSQWALLAALAGSVAVGQDTPRRPAKIALPSLVGTVAEYVPQQLLILEVAQPGGEKRIEFALDKDRTRIELPPRLQDIKPGQSLAVWTEKDRPFFAVKIGVAPEANMRRPGNRSSANPAANTWPPRPVPQPQISRAAVGRPAAEVAGQIDRHIQSKFDAAQISSAPPASDAEFIRRASLDIIGVIPPAERVAAFLNDSSVDKRARLIDELLSNPEYGRHFSELWCARILPRDVPVGELVFLRWLTDEFNSNQGWDKLVFEMLTADGSFAMVRLRAPGEAHEPPALFVIANCEENQPRPDRLAGSAAALFLGLQIQCAECHDHPFAPWKQTDFWGLAAFFGQLRTEKVVDQVSRWREPPLAAGQPAQISIPSTALKSVGTIVPARFLNDAENFRPRDDQLLRHALAEWMTSPENHFFAQATANRLWAHFFGLGLFNPVDDFGEDRPPSHPEVLQLLARELTTSEFDLKHLIRCLCLSQAYQRTSQPLNGVAIDSERYATMPVKVVPPAALYDSLLIATGFRELRLGFPTTKAKQGVTAVVSPRNAFIDFFRSQTEETDALEYRHGIPQALKLLNAAQFHRIAPVVERLARANGSSREVVEQLYLTALSRHPTHEESELVAEYVAQKPDLAPEQRYAGVLWVLLNTAEFVLNH